MDKRNFMWSGLLATFSIFIFSGLFANEEAIEKRQNLMKSNGEASSAIRKAAKANDYATVEAKARQIVANMEKIPGFFPKGSTAANSRAKPEIWEKWDSFNQKRVDVKTAAEELADAAKAKDGEKVASVVGGLGRKCGSCHRTFRAPEKK